MNSASPSGSYDCHFETIIQCCSDKCCLLLTVTASSADDPPLQPKASWLAATFSFSTHRFTHGQLYFLPHSTTPLSSEHTSQYRPRSHGPAQHRAWRIRHAHLISRAPNSKSRTSHDRALSCCRSSPIPALSTTKHTL